MIEVRALLKLRIVVPIVVILVASHSPAEKPSYLSIRVLDFRAKRLFLGDRPCIDNGPSVLLEDYSGFFFLLYQLFLFTADGIYRAK